MIRYECGKCGAEMESPESMAGSTEVCPGCGFEMTMPAAQEVKATPKARRWFIVLAMASVCCAVLGFAIYHFVNSRGRSGREIPYHKRRGPETTLGPIANFRPLLDDFHLTRYDQLTRYHQGELKKGSRAECYGPLGEDLMGPIVYRALVLSVRLVVNDSDEVGQAEVIGWVPWDVPPKMNVQTFFFLALFAERCTDWDQAGSKELGDAFVALVAASDNFNQTILNNGIEVGIKANRTPPVPRLAPGLSVTVTFERVQPPAARFPVGTYRPVFDRADSPRSHR